MYGAVFQRDGKLRGEKEHISGGFRLEKVKLNKMYFFKFEKRKRREIQREELSQ